MHFNSETGELMVALFGFWHGRALPPLPARQAKMFLKVFSGGGYDLDSRLRRAGLTDAACYLNAAELRTDARSTMRRLAARGWRPMSVHGTGWCERLAKSALCPLPLFWICGDEIELCGDAISVVGSRDLSKSDRRFAVECGVEAASSGLLLISGGARGADMTASDSALKNGGDVLQFLPGSATRKPRMHEQFVTPRPEGPVFDRIAALTRNRWIYASGKATILCASRFGAGGAWWGAVEARRAKLGRVIVNISEPASAGNLALARLGAESATTGRDAVVLADFESAPALPFAI